jgi:ketosteroid isomerase-like protein
MKKIFCFTSIQIILMFFYCQAQQTTSASLEEAKKQIEASNGIYFQAFAKKDSSIFINCYTTDCWIMQPNMPALCGPEAALDFFRTAYNKTGIRNGKFITIDIFGNGEEFVTEEGFWQSFDASTRPIDNGKFLVLWKKTPEGWKRFRDSFNSDRNN